MPAKRKVRTKSPRSSKGGRPTYDPTDQDRLTVEQRLASGFSEVQIAQQFGMSRTTLRKHFSKEIGRGRLTRQGELNDILWREARRGASWAVKELMRKTEMAAAEEHLPRQAKPTEAPAPKAPKLGKKEERQAEAEKVASEGIYAVPDGPKLKLVSNA